VHIVRVYVNYFYEKPTRKGFQLNGGLDRCVCVWVNPGVRQLETPEQWSMPDWLVAIEMDSPA
jgi:hypothetical protein